MGALHARTSRTGRRKTRAVGKDGKSLYGIIQAVSIKKCEQGRENKNRSGIMRRKKWTG